MNIFIINGEDLSPGDKVILLDNNKKLIANLENTKYAYETYVNGNITHAIEYIKELALIHGLHYYNEALLYIVKKDIIIYENIITELNKEY